MPETNARVVRAETPHDYYAIRSIHDAAFGHTAEAALVESLREEGVVIVSLVAEIQGLVVGHILFSRMSIETDSASVPAVALAPMAVLAAYQRQGVGSELIRRGLDRLRELGEGIVLVLGHRDYYPRFGFSTEMARSIASPFPPDAFMGLELRPGALEGVRGAVKYPKAFAI